MIHPSPNQAVVVTFFFFVALRCVQGWTTSFVKRIPIESFNFEDYYCNVERQQPLLLAGALSEVDCEACCDTLLAHGGDLEVTLQLQQQQHDDDNKKKKKQPQTTTTTTTTLPSCSLDDAFNAILYGSSSERGIMAFCEGLLDETDDFDGMKRLMVQARERAFANNNDEDWFRLYFPREIQPSDAVVFAGAGATSTLHRDPFEWTGTSLCLEGTKIWRFIDPKNNVGTIDEALQSYRLDSTAWGEEEGVTMSAGWQSDLSLFALRRHDKIPGPRDWSDMEEDAPEKQRVMQELVGDLDVLRPDRRVPTELSLTTAIQQPGDLLLIPAHWWHQTYGLEPSCAVASQRCGKHDAARVLQHILDVNGVEATAQSLLQNETSPGNAVRRLLELLPITTNK